MSRGNEKVKSVMHYVFPVYSLRRTALQKVK